MRCRACQSQIPENGRFCPACGAKVDEASMREVRKTVTVLFCDLANSTELSERFDAEVVHDLMTRYFTLMHDCLVSHGGTVEKFIGDAVMAVFGIPVVREDDPLRAILAAVDMRAALSELNERMSYIENLRVGIRIGINTGEVVTSEQPAGAQALATGSTVNLAARLEQHAGLGEVLLGPQTYRAAAGAVVTEPVGPLRLKGIAEQVVARRLIDIRPGSPALARRLDTPLVGRLRERREFEFILDRCSRDRSCVLLRLFGDPGVGKSRLAAEYEQIVRDRGGVVAAGRCRPYAEGPSLLPLADALRSLTEVVAEDGARLLEADTARAVAALRAGILRDGAPGAALTEVTWAASRLIESLGRDRPVLLVFDDLHWADPMLLDAIRLVASQVQQATAVILGIARTDFMAQWPVAGHQITTAPTQLLRPLSAADTRTLVGLLSDLSAHDVATAEQIVERAEGNPLFAEQLVAILEDGADPRTLPPTISQLIAARLDLLDAGQRALLYAASIVGRDFTLGPLGVVGPGLGGPAPGPELDRMLTALIRRRLIQRSGLVTDSDITFRFTSTAMREVAYESVPKRLRADLHERLADWLEAADDGSAILGTELIGTQLEQAHRALSDLGPRDARTREVGGRAAGQLADAGIKALRRSDMRRAASLLARGDALFPADEPARAACMEGLAEARIAIGDVGPGLQMMKRSRQVARRLGDEAVVAHARLQLVYLEQPSEQFTASLTVASEVLPVFENSHDELGLARAWLRIGQVRQSQGRFGSAVDTLNRALVHASVADAELERASVLGALAVSLWEGPEPVDRAIERCWSLLAEHSTAGLTVRAALDLPLAVLLATAGEPQSARELIADAQKIINEIGHAYAAASVPIFAAAIESLAGEWEQAAGLLADAERQCSALGDAQLEATAAAERARVLLELGRIDDAAALARASSAGMALMPARTAGLRGITARTLAMRGQHAAARQISAEALEAASHTDSPDCQATALLDMAHVHAEARRYRAARSAAERAWQLFGRKGHVVGQQRTAVLLTGRLR
jgi:class 3 adenylate cyclase/tetratricopeptide (TPR) repeat protein